MTTLKYDKDALFVKTFKARHPQGVKVFHEMVTQGKPLAEVAREFKFSRAYASASFKKIFGMKHSEYMSQFKQVKE